LVLAFDNIGDAALAKVNSVLVLGAGVGSAVQILMNRNLHPEYTLVDNDEKILSWLTDLMQHTGEKLNRVHADAAAYMEANNKSFDMMIVDVFTDRVAPPFVTTHVFLQQCRRAIAPGGIFIMNYIVNDETNWQSLLQNIRSVFSNPYIYELEVNRVIIASV
jgi:spermidine synthase